MKQKPTYEELENRIKELESESKKSSNAIHKKANIETDQKLQFLRDSALELITLKSEDEIYEYMGKRLNSLIENAIILINETNVEEKTQVLKQIHGIDNTLLGKASKIMGFNPMEKTFELNDNFEVLYAKGKIKHFQGGIAELSEGTLSSLSSKAIEKLFNISNVYSIGFVKEKQIFGSLHIFTRKGAAIEDYHLIESFINQASIILNKMQTTIALQKAKEKTERNEFELKKAQEISHLGSWTLDVATNEVTWTEELFKMYGFDSTKPVPPYTEHMKLFTPESWELLSVSLEKTRETGVPYELELETVREDKSNGWMWVRGEAVHNTKNKIIGLWGAAQDITARKLVEKSLSESENRFKSLFQNLSSNLSLYEVLLSENGEPYDYRFLAVNSKYEETVGLKEAEVIGKTLLEVFPNTEDVWLQQIKETCLTGITSTTENFASEVNQPIELTVYIPQKGQVAFISPDIAPRKKAEEEAKESEEKYRSLYENAPLSYQSLDEDGCFLDINPMWVMTLGYEREKVIGSWFGDYLHPDYVEHFKINFPAFKKRGYVSDVQFQLRKKDGSHIYVSFEGCVGYTPQGKFKQTYCVFKDISAQKAIEQELIKAKEKAEESDRLKSAFLANMSHEIRTPMNAILGFSDLLKTSNLTSEKKELFLDQIDIGGKRLISLISDIVDISKIDANQLTVNYEACNINSITHNICEQFKVQIINKECEIVVKNGLADTECTILTDELRLSQILSNLIENSLKFTKKGLVEFGYTLEQNTLKFFVKDSGIGINPKHRETIFERFKQVDNDYSKSGSGTGLGLSIVKGLTNLLGGKIWVESELEKGATFYFTIPYKIVESRKVEAPKMDNNLDSDKQITILIAEDEDSNYLYLETILEEHNFKLIRAINGKEAIEEVKNNNSIDLIFMDIKMPVMNGFEATKEIRKTNQRIPIISLTAYAMAEDKQKALNAGCNDYLPKPLSKASLIEIMNEYLEKGNHKL